MDELNENNTNENEVNDNVSKDEVNENNVNEVSEPEVSENNSSETELDEAFESKKESKVDPINNDEIDEDEAFEKKEKKSNPKLQGFTKKLKTKKVLIPLIVILLIIVVIALELTTGFISNLFTRNQVGNSSGNIANCGYSVENDGYIYFVSPSENMYYTQINKAKAGESDSEVIFEGGYDIRGLNIVGDKLYFISISLEDTSDDDGIDNKIYKMDLDGSNATVINDNDFAYDYYEMYVVNNHIYYVGTDDNVYEMDLNGGNRKLVVETETGFLTMNQEYIIYNKDNEDGSDYITYIRKIDGTEEMAITSSRIYTPIIENDIIYYINSDQHLAKISVEGGEEEELTDYVVYNMNISNGYLYYLNYKDEENEDYTVVIFKISLDGGEPESVKELSNYSSFLNIVGDYAYYMDMDDEKTFVNLVNVNDGNETRLYEWSY